MISTYLSPHRFFASLRMTETQRPCSFSPFHTFPFLRSFASIRMTAIAVLLCLAASLSWGTFSLELSAGSVDFGQNLNPDNTPFLKEPAITATVVNNGEVALWTLSASATGPMTSNIQSTTIPISQLQLKGGDVFSYTSFAAAPPIQVETGGTGTFNVVMDYRLNLYWTNPAANDYTATIWYTLTGE